MAERTLYVGYLPAPRRHARAATLLVLTGVLGLGLIAGTLAISQADPGRGVWNTDQLSALTGTLRIDPYPRLVIDGPDAGPREVLLVDQGKVGADDRARPFAGKSVKITGAMIQWGDRAVIELTGASTDFEEIGAGVAAAPAAPAPERVTLEGEIVDPKCYLGVMNPGRGKPHLSCAELCIKGGIPPVLVVRAPGAVPTDPGDCYVLTTAGGGPARELVRGRVGMRVRVSGAASKGPGWWTLAADSIEAR